MYVKHEKRSDEPRMRKMTKITRDTIKKLNPGMKIPSYEDVMDEEFSRTEMRIVNLWEYGLPEEPELTKSQIQTIMHCSNWYVREALKRYDDAHGLVRPWRTR